MFESQYREEGNTHRYAVIAATVGLCAVIALAPLAFGSMDARVVTAWVLLLSAVLLLASLQAVSVRDLAFLLGFTAIALGWIFVVAEQLARAPFLPRELMAPIWKQASSILGEELNGSISVARNQPFFSAGSQLACFLRCCAGFYSAETDAPPTYCCYGLWGLLWRIPCMDFRLGLLAELLTLASRV